MKEFQIDAACMTNIGKIRKKNEDNVYFDGRYFEQEHGSLKKPATIQRFSSEISCFAVFDGMGGERFGEIASYVAVKEFDERKKKLDKIIKSPKEFLKETCFQMNQCVCKQADTLMAGTMGTTASILYFDNDQFYICNIGDSPVFRMHDGELRAIYEEHTNREFLLRTGIKGRTPSLTQSLGIPEDELKIEPYIAKGNLHTGDQFLICSDGLSNMVQEEEIAEILRKCNQIEQCVTLLMEAALNHGGSDNVTLILCKIL